MRIHISMAGTEKHVSVDLVVLLNRQHVDDLIRALEAQRDLIWPEQQEKKSK